MCTFLSYMKRHNSNTNRESVHQTTDSTLSVKQQHLTKANVIHHNLQIVDYGRTGCAVATDSESVFKSANSYHFAHEMYFTIR